MSDPKSPPLVSPRSPSNARAQGHVEDSAEEKNAQRVAELSRLVELEENARGFHERAGANDVAAIHAERRDRLATMVSELGGSAPRPGEIRSLLQAEDAQGIDDELASAYAAAGVPMG